MRISDWSSDVCSSDLTPREVSNISRYYHAAADYKVAQGHITCVILPRPGACSEPGISMTVSRPGHASDGPPTSSPHAGSCAPTVSDQAVRQSGFTPISAQRLAYSSKNCREDRKSVVSGKSVSVRVDNGGRRIIKKKK